MSLCELLFGKKKEKKKIKLKPGQSRCVTSGRAGCIDDYGTACDVCGEEFEFSIIIPLGFIDAKGPYNYIKYGKFKPATMWFCRKHTDKEIEAKLKELDK